MTEKEKKPQHPNSRKNLRTKSWQPGQSGNPKGRPKGLLSKSTILNRFLDLVYKDQKGLTRPQPFGSGDVPITVEEAIVLSLIKKALGGSETAIKELLDIKYGKNPDVQAYEGRDGERVDPEWKVTVVDAKSRND